MPLVVHDVELTNSIYDPLHLDFESFQYLTAAKESEITVVAKPKPPFDKSGNLDIKVELKLNGYLKVESRTRYSVWDLLGDVGGLHDGLVIFFAIFVGPFSTFSFSNDFIKGRFIDVSNKQHDRTLQGSARFRGVIKKISSETNSKVDPDTLDMVAKAMNSARKL